MPTIKDVAKLAHVSVSTVSRVLNQSGYVSERVCQDVYAAVRQLGYKPNSIAQSLKKNSSHTIGLIVADITNPYFAAIAKGSENYFSQYGYNLIICNTNESPEKERTHLEMLFDRRVDGILLCSTGRNNEVIQRLLDAGIKIILIDRSCPGLTLDIIKDNNEYGAYLLTNLLIERGHKKIVFLRGDKGSTASTERECGWRSALKENGLSAGSSMVFTAGSSGENTKDVMDSLLSLNEQERPTAVFASNSLIAKQVIMKLNESSVAVPEQMALVCYGLEEFKTLYRPSITCIIQRPDHVGYLSAQLMMERLKDSGEQAMKEIILAPELFEGQST